MIIFKQPLRSPDAAPGTPASAPARAPSAPAPKPQAKAPAAAPRGAQAGPRDNAPAPSEQNIQESAADRAIARKAAADAERAPREKPKVAKVAKLDDIKALNSNKVRVRKTATVETDNMALPEPKPEAPRLEDGRPDPKRSRQSQAPEVEAEPVEDDFPAPLEMVDAVEAEEVVQDEPLETEAEPFTPNLKFKAYGQEFDIPERFQGLITDAESEKEVHNVFSRAHAFDKTRERLGQADQHIQRELMPRLNHYDGIRAELGELAQSGDIFGLVERFGIDANKVLMAAAERIRMEQADPAIRQEHERRVAAEKANRESTRRIETLEAQTANNARAEKTRVFESLLIRDDVSAVANSFDEKLGEPGAFKKMIQARAQSIYLNSERDARGDPTKIVDLTPQQAILGFMQEYGLTLSPQAPKAPGKPANAAPARTPGAAPAARTPKTIPNINSRTNAVGSGKPEINGIKDIIAARKQKYGR